MTSLILAILLISAPLPAAVSLQDSRETELLEKIALREAQVEETLRVISKERLKRGEEELALKELGLQVLLARTNRAEERLGMASGEWGLVELRRARRTGGDSGKRTETDLALSKSALSAISTEVVRNNIEVQKLRLALIRLDASVEEVRSREGTRLTSLVERDRKVLKEVIQKLEERGTVLQDRAKTCEERIRLLEKEVEEWKRHGERLREALIDMRVRNLLSATDEEAGFRLFAALALAAVLYLLKRLRPFLPALLRRAMGNAPEKTLERNGDILLLGATLILTATALAAALGYIELAYLFLRRIGALVLVLVILAAAVTRFVRSEHPLGSLRRSGVSVLLILFAILLFAQVWRLPLRPAYETLMTYSPILIKKILRILFLLAILSAFFVAVRRIVGYILNASSGRRGGESNFDREQRLKTLSWVFDRSMTAAAVVIAVFLLLREVGFDIMPFLAGAGIVGIALGLGAQSLVKDFLSGFFILMENQYCVGNVVRIGELSGQVEQLGLRTTVLRDVTGAVHVIPNGEITRVSNLTHEWSRAILDIGVAYTEDLEHVSAVMEREGRKLREDPVFSEFLTEDPRVLGVEAFEDSSITLRMVATTLPMKQWDVARELRLRLKKAFDAEGIEIPFPQRVVYSREERPAKKNSSLTESARASKPYSLHSDL